MTIHVSLDRNSYDIEIASGIIHRAGEYCDLNRKVMVVSDAGVPKEFWQTVMSQSKEAVSVILEPGEKSKSLESFGKIQKELLHHDFTRKDCVVAVGGGVVGDLAGFAAACYMRGIDFYNIPTTVLSQVDSSIGGKTAINFEGVKNVVGAFYQPQKVLIDPEVLKTLPERQLSNGLAEAVKMAATSDEVLFRKFEQCRNLNECLALIPEAIKIKQWVVQEDEKEKNLRKVLNFGHTIGHGIEAACDGTFYHGECVALGMLPMCSEEVKRRLFNIYQTLNLPTACRIDIEKAVSAMEHDKKTIGNEITVVFVPEIGSFEFRKETLGSLTEKLKQVGEERKA
ncbi:MAG: 3-dehydroquinate synthase [Lachnospiraceae bacterium]